jgi:hypothetical protein
MGKVAENRAAAKAAGQTMKEYKAANNITPKETSAATQAKKESRPGSVAYNRAQAANAGQSMKEYKTEHGIAKNRAQTYQSNQDAAASQDKYGAFKSHWSDKVSGYRQQHADFMDRQMNLPPGQGRAGTSFMEHHFMETNEDGLLNWDSTKPIYRVEKDDLIKLGFKPGDMLFDPNNYKNINETNGTTGQIDADAWMRGFVMPLGKTEGSLEKHAKAMEDFNRRQGVSSTERMDSTGLYQDQYFNDDEGNMGSHMGSDHYDSVQNHNKGLSLIGHNKGGDLWHSYEQYREDGGYPGEFLRHLDKNKEGHDIKRYNQVVSDAQAFDWNKTIDKYGFDPRVGPTLQ